MTEKSLPIPSEQWDLVIRPQRAWWDLRLGDLWRYRDLVMLLVRRDFVAQYKQTILGPLWYLIQPILTTTVFTVIFDRVAQLPTDGLPPFLFYMAGNTIWSYFASSITATANTFVANSGIFGKVYFPRLAIPLSVVISNLISFTIRLSVFVVFLVYFILSGSDVHLNAWALALPLLLFLMGGLGLGFGIIISSLTTKYRDLQQLLSFGVQLMMYATPIIYPLSMVSGSWKWVLLANPVTPVVEIFRLGFLGTSSISPWYLLYTLAFTIIVLLAGVLLFTRVENTFMDTV
jgi:lipopolysaccharide transport system permease protein